MKKSLPSFRGRAFVSILVSVCFLLLVFSGAILFLAPPGRVANWTHWQILALTKHDWIDIHIWFALVFLVAGLVHLWFNWRPLVGYFKNRLAQRLGRRWEWVAALALCLGVYAGIRAQLPPFSTVLAWNEQLKERWDRSTERPPIAHAELLPLHELAQQAGVPLESALQRLTSHGLLGVSADIQVGALAAQNQLAPLQVYNLITTGSTQTPSPARKDSVDHAQGGGGYGRKTLDTVCTEKGLHVTQALARLEARGIHVTPGTTLRDIATKYGGSNPQEILSLIEGEPPSPQTE